VAFLVSAILISVVLFLTFGALRVRPRRLTVPIGCILTVILTWATGVEAPAWGAALGAGTGLAALALSVERDRARIVGMFALPVIVIATLVIPRIISTRTQTDARARQLAALGFPLLLPNVPGYHASGTYAVNRGLSVAMTLDSGPSGYPAFTVNITPAAATVDEVNTAPVKCSDAVGGCRVLRADVWSMTSGIRGGEVITWHGDLEVDAMSLAYMPVTTQALLQAATDLRPATADALASIGQ